MAERYYIGEQPTPSLGATLRLSPAESRHVTKVMRQKVGDSLLLFDGRGGEFIAQLIAIQKDSVEARIDESMPLAPKSSRQLTIAAALPKGDRQKWMVEKLMELGTARIIPIITRYAVTKADAPVVERLRRQAVEASKQCGAKYLPKIIEEKTLEELSDLTEQESVWFAHPVRDAAIGQCLPGKLPKSDKITVLIGPTGGFAPEEVEFAQDAGWLPLDLGPYLLRTETAAIAIAASLLLHSEAEI